MNEGEREKVDVTEENMLEGEQEKLVYTSAPGPKQQNPRSERLVNEEYLNRTVNSVGRTYHSWTRLKTSKITRKRNDYDADGDKTFAT